MLVVNAIQLAVIYEFLYHTRLGDQNAFTSEISDLMIGLEEEGLQEELEGANIPKIKVSFSEDEGLVFDLE